MAAGVRLLQVGPCRWSGVYLLRPGETAPPTSTSPVPAGTSSFVFFFRPILPALGAYWWVDPPLEGKADDPDWTKACSSLTEDRWAPPGLLLPRFAGYMPEDWCDCLGFVSKPPDADAVHAQVMRNGRPIWEADLGFRNVDGAYWLMSSRDDRLTTAVVEYARSIPGLEVSWQDGAKAIN